MSTLNLSDRREPEEPNGNGSLFKVKWLTLLPWIVAALLAYAAVDRRVAVLETKYETVNQQLSEIRADIKVLLQRTAKP